MIDFLFSTVRNFIIWAFPLNLKLFSWFLPDYSGTGKGGECHRVVCFASSVLRCLRYSDIVMPNILRKRFFGLFSLLNPHIEIMRAIG